MKEDGIIKEWTRKVEGNLVLNRRHVVGVEDAKRGRVMIMVLMGEWRQKQTREFSVNDK